MVAATLVAASRPAQERVSLNLGVSLPGAGALPTKELASDQTYLQLGKASLWQSLVEQPSQDAEAHEAKQHQMDIG